MNNNTNANASALQRATVPEVKYSDATLELLGDGKIYAASQMFKDVTSAAQALVKIKYGRSLGFDEISSLSLIYFFDGRPHLSAKCQAALVKGSGRFDYTVDAWTNESCKLTFYKLNGTRTKIGEIEYRFEDAVKAGLTGKDNWKKYPKEMMFATAVKRGVTMFCPEILRTAGQTVNALAEFDAIAPELAGAPDGFEIPVETPDVQSEVVTDARAAEALEEEIESEVVVPQDTVSGSAAKAVGIAAALAATGIDPDDIAVQFLPEGVSRFEDLTEADAAEIVPSMAEILHATITANTGTAE